ncbi:MAG: hypothetical protein BWY68_00366 [bacterium ADurb.Bin400]|nr:MAG: hypothetical protein BWY68_00366 [bacterium ADurb.Bin400]
MIDRVLAVSGGDLSGVVGVRNTHTNLDSFTDLVTLVIGWVLTIAGILAFFYLLYSGILYITAAGNPDAAKKGQQGIINAVIGIIVIGLAYVILRAATSAGTNGTL